MAEELCVVKYGVFPTAQKCFFKIYVTENHVMLYCPKIAADTLVVIIRPYRVVDWFPTIDTILNMLAVNVKSLFIASRAHIAVQSR